MDTLKLLSRSSRLNISGFKDSKNKPLPSAAGQNGTGKWNDDDIRSRKRKRVEFEEMDLPKALGEVEIRKFQKQHKIRITDLRLLHDTSKSESHKAQKEASRLFPQPLLTFSQLKQWNINQKLLTNLAHQAYREPTEVQMAAIPLLIESNKVEPDLLTVAPTGSGKTLAFLIPLIHKISKSRHDVTEAQAHASSLIIVPTKELAGQIVNEGKKLVFETGIRIVEMRRGMRLIDADDTKDNDEGESSSDDEEADDVEGSLKGTVAKADIIVSTPLTLLNAIAKNRSLHSPLSHIQNLILDEADYLLDPLFRDQVMSIWSGCTSPALHVSLWSATIGSSIEELALSKIGSHSPKGRKRLSPLVRIVVGLKDTSIPTIDHKLVYASTEQGKLMGLRQILHPSPSIAKGQAPTTPVLRPPFLIFTQTIPRAIALHEELKYDIPAAAGGSIRVAALHSSLSSKQRAKIMTEFRQGKVWILITTDLLSRGIDFRGINGVVNYDIPTTAASYVHRAGRTGRAGRQGGICVTFYTRDDIKYLKPIANLISVSENKETQNMSGSRGNDCGMPAWLLAALPELSKQDRKDLKQRGVGVRRAVKESDGKEERRKKGKNRIGTSSGYERRLKGRKQGMVEGSKRRKKKELERTLDENSDDGFEGFRD